MWRKEGGGGGWGESICVSSNFQGRKGAFMGKVEIYYALELALEPSSHCLMNNNTNKCLVGSIESYVRSF